MGASYIYIALLGIDTYNFIHGKEFVLAHQTLLVISIFLFLIGVYTMIRKGILNTNKQLANTSFFIFAFHIFFINILNKFWPIILPVNTFNSILVQILIPTITCGICVRAFYLLRWTMPSLCTILIGGRNK